MLHYWEDAYVFFWFLYRSNIFAHIFHNFGHIYRSAGFHEFNLQKMEPGAQWSRFERYAQQLQANGGRLYLTGVHSRVLEQLELTETTETIPEDAIYLAEDKLGASTKVAYQSAQNWLEELETESDENSGTHEGGEGDSDP